MPDIVSRNPLESPFEKIKHVDENGEHWFAREVQSVLGYKNWRECNDVIERAKNHCVWSHQNVNTHFALKHKLAPLGRGAIREIIDYRISRYGLLLTLINADMKKSQIVEALGYIALSLTETMDNAYAQAKKLEIIFPDEIAITKEQKTIGVIARAFKHLKPVPQFYISPYRIDLYFPDQKIAVECDEDGHQRSIYPEKREKERQSSIERRLGCAFIRFNPDSPKFHLGDVINQIMMKIYA